MTVQRITDEILPQLREWFEFNHRAGIDISQLGGTLREAGYIEDEIETFLRREQDRISHQAPDRPFDADPIDLSETTAGRFWNRLDVLNAFNDIHAHDRIVRIVAKSSRYGVIYVSNFLSAPECDSLIAAAQAHLSGSTVIDDADAGDVADAGRSSRGAVLYRGSTPAIQAIESRIARLTNIPVAHGEGIQILSYRPGQEYRPHFDYFDPKTPGGARIIAEGGQRVATLIMYLSDVENGGGTQFPQLSLEFTPTKGAAPLFASVGREGELLSSSLHAGCPIISGEKWIATKWLRQIPFDKVG